MINPFWCHSSQGAKATSIVGLTSLVGIAKNIINSFWCHSSQGTKASTPSSLGGTTTTPYHTIQGAMASTIIVGQTLQVGIAKKYDQSFLVSLFPRNQSQHP
jgi:hypothetical protein